MNFTMEIFENLKINMNNTWIWKWINNMNLNVNMKMNIFILIENLFLYTQVWLSNEYDIEYNYSHLNNMNWENE